MKSARQYPLLNHNLDSPSAFKPEDLVSAVRAARSLPELGIPPLCLLDFDGDLTDWLVSHGKATSFEQLRVSGAQLILGLTSAGRVSPSLPLPSFVIVTSAVRDEGTSLHYLPPGDEIACPTPIGDLLKDEIRRLGLTVVQGSVWTTDAPYRETTEQLQRHAAAGVLAVEMQAASLFAFATAHQVGIGIVAHVTNAVDHQDEQFDKGTDEDTFTLLRAMLRAGRQYIERTDVPR
jgi:uridine phosphorylase